MAADQPSLATLRDAEYQDTKGIWDTGEKLTTGSTNNAGGQPDPVRSRHPRPPVELPVSRAGGHFGIIP